MLAHCRRMLWLAVRESAPISASLMMALGLGVAPESACGLPSARASAIRNREVKQFKEKRIPKEGALRAKTFVREGGAVVERAVWSS